ncbi:MAG: class I SAM-dependent methyltransferase [Candidatus Bathyarchaeota archaeon]|nr:class I SAM-dependent methyltransferase [Candidatus Bathyarchaeota archaeon]
MKEKDYMDVNLKRWNDLVDINAKSKWYDLEGFREGKTSLLSIEREELGDVRGKSLLHLQCHFGMDTLSWARLGADVTGIDFSDRAIELAKCLSEELNIPATFIHSNVYDVSKKLQKKFDIVFTSYGVLCWLPDMVRWAQVVSHCLKPGGIFYVIDSHPFGFLIDENQEVFRIGYNYFTNGEPTYWDKGEAYADPNANLKNQASYEWFHTMSDIINALIDANLELEFLHEFSLCYHNIHPDMNLREDGYWEFKDFKYSLPMMFSVKAHKK